MNGVLLDSDVIIEVLRGRNPDFTSAFESLLATSIPLYRSAVSAAEISHGARESETASIAALMALIRCLPASCAAGEEAGSILKRFRPSHGAGLGDALIAATAIKYKLILWTRNRKQYPDPRIRFFEFQSTIAESN
jgi:predicted nucleic acid-binding protein